MYADIIVNLSVDALDKSFQYRIPPELEEQAVLGSRVDIPFGSQIRSGYIIGLSDAPKLEEDRIREILGPSKKAVPVESTMLALAAWMKERYGCTFHQALKTVLPAPKKVKKGRTRVQTVREEELHRTDETSRLPLTLNGDQLAAVAAVQEELRGGKRPCLLYGVTGSGKTEVYSELIARTAAEGKQTILLIPEIGLTYQNLRRFYERFGDRVGVINSRLSEGEKYENIRRAQEGEIDLMIGPRSALFAPFPQLGLVIIDEEHDHAYHSDYTPRYHSREVAEKLCELTGAGLVLGSATPSVESYYRAQKGEMRLLRLPHRAVPGSLLPSVHTVDLREELAAGNKSVFSRLLTEKITERLEKKEQTMLFLNRRGYAGFVSCRSCGKALKCPHCDVSLTLHRGGRLFCHYCGFTADFPEKCPVCASPYIAAFGTGTQKVETIVQKAFPSARVIRMDADTTTGKGGHSRILSAFSHEEADILVGTQMIVKGHDFPNVTLVGILAADLSLHTGSFRASEETFQLLTQAAGRAGRAGRPGDVVVQSYMPEHFAIRTAAEQNYEGFFAEEMEFRRLMHYPPAGGMLGILILGRDAAEASAAAYYLKEKLQPLLPKYGAELIGPVEGPVAKIKDVYRQLMYLKAPSREFLCRVGQLCSRTFPERVQCDLL